jgi:hypothetical protein
LLIPKKTKKAGEEIAKGEGESDYLPTTAGALGSGQFFWILEQWITDL